MKCSVYGAAQDLVMGTQDMVRSQANQADICVLSVDLDVVTLHAQRRLLADRRIARGLAVTVTSVTVTGV